MHHRACTQTECDHHYKKQMRSCGNLPTRHWATEPLIQPCHLSPTPCLSCSFVPHGCAALLAAGWLLPLASFCLEKRQPDCHYRPKQPPKVKPRATSAPRRKAPSSAKQPAVSTRSASGGTKVPGSRQQHALGLSPVASLKRWALAELCVREEHSEY